jgi:MauM/NapG family ferredoxin protein
MRRLRIASQIVFFVFFFALFFIASYPLTSTLPVDLFFRLDPLTWLSGMLSTRAFIATGLLSLIVILLTIPLGRVFCGWICPLGTFLDFFDRIVGNRNRIEFKKSHNVKYFLLILFFFAAVLGTQVFWFLDPLPLLNRFAVTVLLPILNILFYVIFGFLFRFESFQSPLSQIQNHLVASLLPIEILTFQASVLIFLFFGTVLALGFLTRRFWCQGLCPLGALLALLSKSQILKRVVNEKCTECLECQKVCKVNAIQHDPLKTTDIECIQCFNCVEVCPYDANDLKFVWPVVATGYSLSRRKFLGAAALGLVTPLVLKTQFQSKQRAMRLIRPPGSLPEQEFLDRCIRCHQCIKVCSTSGDFLQPAIGEAGIEGFLTPIGSPRSGWCEYNCVMCTEVCPTGAIHQLDVESKKKTRIGLAFIDKDRCLPYYKDQDCIVCEEHCPTPDKAIKFKEETVILPNGERKTIKRPYVVEELCIGCGICETKCPVTGRSAIYVTSQNEQRYSSR